MSDFWSIGGQLDATREAQDGGPVALSVYSRRTASSLPVQPRSAPVDLEGPEVVVVTFRQVRTLTHKYRHCSRSQSTGDQVTTSGRSVAPGRSGHRLDDSDGFVPESQVVPLELFIGELTPSQTSLALVGLDIASDVFF